MRYARRKGALIVAAAGNIDLRRASPTRPRCPASLSVGAVTEHGCLAEYSNTGPGLDLVAPGGGEDAPLLGGQPGCRPDGPPGARSCS